MKGGGREREKSARGRRESWKSGNGKKKRGGDGEARQDGDRIERERMLFFFRSLPLSRFPFPCCVTASSAIGPISYVTRSEKKNKKLALSPWSVPETIRLLLLPFFLSYLTVGPHRRLDDRRELLARVDVLVDRLLQARVVAVPLLEHSAEAIGQARGGHGGFFFLSFFLSLVLMR